MGGVCCGLWLVGAFALMGDTTTASWIVLYVAAMAVAYRIERARERKLDD